MDSGVLLKKARYQLEKVELLCDANNPEIDLQALIDEIKTEEAPKSQNRFETVSYSDLDSLALERNSYRTRKETMWGVKVFKVESRHIKKIMPGP